MSDMAVFEAPGCLQPDPSSVYEALYALTHMYPKIAALLMQEVAKGYFGPGIDPRAGIALIGLYSVQAIAETLKHSKTPPDMAGVNKGLEILSESLLAYWTEQDKDWAEVAARRHFRARGQI